MKKLRYVLVIRIKVGITNVIHMSEIYQINKDILIFFGFLDIHH